MTATTSQRKRAEALLALHHRGRVLVLPNVWDPIGARVLEARGYPAVATASAAISASLGYADGEQLTRSTMLGVVARISRSVDVPVTADMESGYGESLSHLKETIDGVLDAGAVGVNIEDSAGEEGVLRDIDAQCQRIAAVRETADTRGIPLVINARVDTFLSSRFTDDEARWEETIARGRAYAQAGADCLYPIGPGDRDTLTVLRSGLTTPINALASRDAASLAEMEAIGINRVSFGPFIFRSCLRRFVDIADTIRAGGDYDCFSRETLTRAETATFLAGGRETEEASDA